VERRCVCRRCVGKVDDGHVDNGQREGMMRKEREEIEEGRTKRLRRRCRFSESVKLEVGFGTGAGRYWQQTQREEPKSCRRGDEPKEKAEKGSGSNKIVFEVEREGRARR
jgi:hypothetical protein